MVISPAWTLCSILRQLSPFIVTICRKCLRMDWSVSLTYILFIRFIFLGLANTSMLICRAGHDVSLSLSGPFHNSYRYNTIHSSPVKSRKVAAALPDLYFWFHFQGLRLYMYLNHCLILLHRIHSVLLSQWTEKKYLPHIFLLHLSWEVWFSHLLLKSCFCLAVYQLFYTVCCNLPCESC